jgi:xylulokinase
LAIAGIDIGTTGCKCTIYDIQGNVKGESYIEYDGQIAGNTHTLNPSVVWESVCEVLRLAAQSIDKIYGIGVTSFGEAAILLDKHDQPIMDSLLYTDKRGQDQCEKLVDSLGVAYMTEHTGLNPSPMYSISKLMWIKENHPDLMNRCKRICLFEDFIVYMLSGIHQIDYSLASRTMAFNINELEWDESIFNYAGIKPELMGKVVPIGQGAGIIKEDIATMLDINKDALIVSGCHDQIASAIGAGVLKPGMAVDGIGTVECITPIFDTNIDRSRLYSGSYAIVPFLNNTFATYAFSLSGGALLKWYRDKIAPHEAERAVIEGVLPYVYFESLIQKSEPSNLLILPHFSGAATPYMDDMSTGAIIGLSQETSKIDIYQGLMEGITFEMKVNLEHLEAAGISVDSIFATGGGAKSKYWMQLKADIFNRPIVTMEASQSGALGCIMLVAVACGIFSDLEEAGRTFIQKKEVYTPDKLRHEAYMKKYKKYKKMYKAVKSVVID